MTAAAGQTMPVQRLLEQFVFGEFWSKKGKKYSRGTIVLSLCGCQCLYMCGGEKNLCGSYDG